MAANISFYSFASDNDDDFIDMELSSSPTTTFYYTSSSNSSSPKSREFEFQMCFNFSDRDAITSPADDLFYKGKLLPLYLPPRLEMVENITRGCSRTATSTRFDFIAEKEFEDDDNDDEDDDCYSMAFTETCTNVTSSPLESANISPLESCRVSCDLGLDDYYLEWSSKSGGFIKNQPAKNRSSWSNKLKIIKLSIFVGKLKASKDYLKSLFRMSGCSSHSCGKVKCNAWGGKARKQEDNKHFKVAKKDKLGQIGGTSHPKFGATKKGIGTGIDKNEHSQRSSFSSAYTQRSPSKCLSSSSSNSSSSSSFSLSSGGFPEMHYHSRTSNATGIEGSIEAAIAYCKKSQTCSISAPRIGGEEGQKGPAICSIG